jgi:quercetin dioxygenase-like cupin family protein
MSGFRISQEDEMRNFRLGKRAYVLAATSVFATFIAITVYAAMLPPLPPRSVEPDLVPTGTLAGKTRINVLSVDAFLRAMSQEQGTNAVLQRGHFDPGQSTLWHTHPGPNINLIVGGSVTLTDERCRVTEYSEGEGFATGLKKHVMVAGPNGADFYAFYFLPGQADFLRKPPAGESLDPPKCFGK